MAYFISDGEGGLIPLEGGLPSGYGGPVYQGRWDGSEWQDMAPVDPRIVNDPALRFGEQGSLPYQLASIGRLDGGLSSPDAVAKYLNAVAPNFDWSGAIQNAYGNQVSQFGSGFNSGADDPAQTALKIIQASGQPWAADAENYIRSTPDFAKSQAMGAQSQLYAQHQNDGTIFGIPTEAAGLALSLGLGPMGMNLSGMLGGGVLGAAGTGAVSSALLGGDPLQGALMGGLTPGLEAAGLSPELAQALSMGTKFALSGGNLGPSALFSGALNLAGSDLFKNIANMGPFQSDAGADDSQDWGPAWTYDPTIQDQQDAEYGQAIRDWSYPDPIIDGVDTRTFGSSPGAGSSYQPGLRNGGLTAFLQSQQPLSTLPGDYAQEPDYTVPDIATPDNSISLGGGGWFSPSGRAGYYIDDNGNWVRDTSNDPQPDMTGFYTPDPAWLQPEQPITPTVTDSGTAQPIQDNFVLPGYAVDLGNSTQQIPVGPEQTFNNAPDIIQQILNVNSQQDAQQNTQQDTQQTPSQETGNNMDYSSIYDLAQEDAALGDYWKSLGVDIPQGSGYSGNVYGPLGDGTVGDASSEDAALGQFWKDIGVTAPQGTGAGNNVYNLTGNNASAYGGLFGTFLRSLFGSKSDGTVNFPGTSTNKDGSSNGLLPLLAVLGGGLLGMQKGSNTPAGSTTSTQDVPDWQKPYITGMLDNAGKVYKAAEDNNGFLSNGRNTLNSAINGDFLNANPSNAIYGAAAGYNNPYEGLLQPTATGAFLNANPYLDATYDKASRAMVDQYKYATIPNLSRQFGHMQAFGGNSGYDQSVGLAQKNLATGLGDLATGIYGGNYANERGMMQNAQTGLLGSSNATQGIRLSGAGGIGGNFNTARQQQLSAATTAPGYASETTNNAFAPINNYANLVGRSFGSQTQQPYFTNQSGGMLSGALGGLALANLFKG